MLLELAAEGDKGLDIAAAPDDLDDDVELDGELVKYRRLSFLFGKLGVFWGSRLLFGWERRLEVGDEAGKGTAEARVDIDIDSTIVYRALAG